MQVVRPQQRVVVANHEKRAVLRIEATAAPRVRAHKVSFAGVRGEALQNGIIFRG